MTRHIFRSAGRSILAIYSKCLVAIFLGIAPMAFAQGQNPVTNTSNQPKTFRVEYAFNGNQESKAATTIALEAELVQLSSIAETQGDSRFPYMYAPILWHVDGHSLMPFSLVIAVLYEHNIEGLGKNLTGTIELAINRSSFFGFYLIYRENTSLAKIVGNILKIESDGSVVIAVGGSGTEETIPANEILAIVNRQSRAERNCSIGRGWLTLSGSQEIEAVSLSADSKKGTLITHWGECGPWTTASQPDSGISM